MTELSRIPDPHPAQTAGGPDLITPALAPAHAAAAPPIFQTTAFLFDSYAQLADVFAGRSDRYIYSRGDNPTVSELEALIARLEGCEAARGFASGMAAIAGATLPFLRSGDRIVTVEHIYSDTFRLFETVLARFGVETCYVDGRDTAAVLAALPGARMVYLESPTSWLFHTQDVARIATEARRLGVLSVIDNSWATPVFQRPAVLGVDLVVHAASKYLAGHSDTIGGLVAGPRALIERIDHEATHLLGGRMAPFDAFLVLRGLRTLDLRMARHQANGLALARALAASPLVTAVHHPALRAAPAPGLQGHGGLFSFDLAEGVDVERFTDALQHVRIGVGWGGAESLVVPAQAALGLAGPSNVFRRFGVSPRTVRLSAGLEPAELVVADVLGAIAAGAGVAA
jgi:cystathionine beta-lyase/cystathionine gamma-synthase